MTRPVAAEVFVDCQLPESAVQADNARTLPVGGAASQISLAAFLVTAYGRSCAPTR